MLCRSHSRSGRPRDESGIQCLQYTGAFGPRLCDLCTILHFVAIYGVPPCRGIIDGLADGRALAVGLNSCCVARVWARHWLWYINGCGRPHTVGRASRRFDVRCRAGCVIRRPKKTARTLRSHRHLFCSNSNMLTTLSLVAILLGHSRSANLGPRTTLPR
ncbi:hypothetical protein FA95DRAFT_1279828 [Auriscalpium vulgare]|uniref:Uncharacterized protein n=1 Tax=Auriscalpium vulgare TaxID=40419 RepID=A0ACB8R2C7_9AGAM|nr:hypothetical protein FA95DRAFT_1279828 [Auriscalpium vulgare]